MRSAQPARQAAGSIAGFLKSSATGQLAYSLHEMEGLLGPFRARLRSSLGPCSYPDRYEAGGPERLRPADDLGRQRKNLRLRPLVSLLGRFEELISLRLVELGSHRATHWQRTFRCCLRPRAVEPAQPRGVPLAGVRHEVSLTIETMGEIRAHVEASPAAAPGRSEVGQSWDGSPAQPTTTWWMSRDVRTQGSVVVAASQRTCPSESAVAAPMCCRPPVAREPTRPSPLHVWVRSTLSPGANGGLRAQVARCHEVLFDSASAGAVAGRVPRAVVVAVRRRRSRRRVASRSQCAASVPDAVITGEWNSWF